MQNPTFLKNTLPNLAQMEVESSLDSMRNNTFEI